MEDKSFKLVDGKIIHNFEELIEAIRNMTVPVFNAHVNETKNDFYPWLNDVLKRYDVAEAIQHIKDRKHYLIILEHFNNRKILVFNAGSSSLKFQVIESQTEIPLIKGVLDAIGRSNSSLSITAHGQTINKELPIRNHDAAVVLALKALTSFKIVESLNEISIIGHRVVHGGEKFTKPTIITDEVIDEIHALSNLAPLHNPANLAGIIACKKHLSNKKQIAVFDTAFHATIPKMAFMYGLPYELYEKLDIRKYGFHGISNQYVSKKVSDIMGTEKSEMIICHLGNGSSITAIKDGESVDTSMGFTPLDGLIMGTRSGDIDPEIIFFLLRRHYGIDQLENILNKQSGLRGLTGTSDMRELWEKSQHGDTRAALAINMLAYRISLFVGGYMTILNGLDALVFTGGIGENAWYVREKVCEALGFVGLVLDDIRNKNNDIEISASDSKIKVYVVQTNEELEIAKECVKIEKTVRP